MRAVTIPIAWYGSCHWGLGLGIGQDNRGCPWFACETAAPRLSSHSVAQLEVAERIGHVDSAAATVQSHPPGSGRGRSPSVPGTHRGDRLQRDGLRSAGRGVHRRAGRTAGPGRLALPQPCCDRRRPGPQSRGRRAAPGRRRHGVSAVAVVWTLAFAGVGHRWRPRPGPGGRLAAGRRYRPGRQGPRRERVGGVRRWRWQRPGPAACRVAGLRVRGETCCAAGYSGLAARQLQPRQLPARNSCVASAYRSP